MPVIIVTGRGGAGKTTTTANLSVYFAQKEYRTLAIDGDLFLPNLGFHFALENVNYTVHSLLKIPMLTRSGQSTNMKRRELT